MEKRSNCLLEAPTLASSLSSRLWDVDPAMLGIVVVGSNS